MTKTPDTDGSPCARAEHKRMFLHRAARLARLITLEAPDMILVREVMLVMKAARRMDPESYFRAKLEEEVLASKRALHLCETDGCDESVVVNDVGRHLVYDARCAKHGEEELEEERAQANALPYPDHDEDAS